MIETKRYIGTIDYKVLNQPTCNVEVVKANDYQTAKRILEEKYNSNGMTLIQIRTLRLINNE